MHVCFLYVVIFIYVFCTINIKFSLKKKKIIIILDNKKNIYILHVPALILKRSLKIPKGCSEDRQYHRNKKIDKRINNDLQTLTQKTKD